MHETFYTATHPVKLHTLKSIKAIAGARHTGHTGQPPTTASWRAIPMELAWLHRPEIRILLKKPYRGSVHVAGLVSHLI